MGGFERDTASAMESPVLEVEQAQGGGLQTAKDLFSGAMGGIAQVMIGMRRFYFVCSV